MSPSVAAKSFNSTATTSTASMRSSDSTFSTSVATSSASAFSNSSSPVTTDKSSSSKPPSTASASTQTSPADIRLSAVGDEELSLWASSYAPTHWLSTEMEVISRSNNSSSLERGSKEELDKCFGFVHVQPR